MLIIRSSQFFEILQFLLDAHIDTVLGKSNFEHSGPSVEISSEVSKDDTVK